MRVPEVSRIHALNKKSGHFLLLLFNEEKYEKRNLKKKDLLLDTLA